MKKLFLITCFITVLLLQGKAQYQSFFGKEKTEYSIVKHMTCYQQDYNPQGLGVCSWTNRLSFSSSDTTTINETLYYVSSIDNFNVGPFTIREDTTTGRIYRYLPDLDEEILICDMSLNVGDTFKLFREFYHSYYNETLIVDSIAYINGRKIIHFPDMYGTTEFFSEIYSQYGISLKFIEGIGPTYGPFGYYPFTYEHYLGLLLCVYKDDTLAYMLHEDLGCSQSQLSVMEFKKDVIRIYPNPSYDQITVSCETDWNDTGEIIISDMLGCIVYRKKTINLPDVIDISKFSSGIYTLIIQGKKNSYISKFIKY